VPEFARLADEALRAIGELAEAVRGSEQEVSLPELRPLHAELMRVLERGRQAEALAPEVAASVIEATDRLVNSLNSIAAVLAERGQADIGPAAS
jgi:hypothetical protein